MKEPRQITINLTKEQWKKLDYYGYDYQKNTEEQCINVYNEILKCESELNQIKYKVEKKKRVDN